jgi:hypothetical protein
MADTTNLTLAKPVIGDEGWGTVLNTLFDRLDLLLGYQLAADEDPNVSAVEGYKNAILIDSSANGAVWICTANGTTNWVHLSLELFKTLTSQTQVWENSQIGKWRSESPVGNTIDLTRDDAFVYVNLSVDAEVQLPTGTYALEEAHMIILAVEAGTPANTLTFDPLYFKGPGGIAPPSPIDDTITYYTLIREYASSPDRWIVALAPGYDSGVI